MFLQYLDQNGQLEGRGHTIPEKKFKKLSPDDEKRLLKELFVHYRKVGYPYHPSNDGWRQKEWKVLMKTEPSVMRGKVIRQTMTGLSLAWSYHKHAHNVAVGIKKSCLEAFNNDAHFMRILKSRLGMGTYYNNSGLRKALKLNTGVQGISNFRPTAASSLYLHFLDNPSESIVWDPCAGFSGRLLGACLAGVGTYIGSEPCTLTYDGLMETKRFAEKQPDCTTKIQILHQRAEDFPIKQKKIDMVFTSPPYFDTEKYSHEPTQSWVQYPTKEKWLAGFMKKLIVNAYDNLKDEGILALNVADVRTYPHLVSDTRALAVSLGFQFLGELKYSLSSMPSSTQAHKFEPILIFTKS